MDSVAVLPRCSLRTRSVKMKECAQCLESTYYAGSVNWHETTYRSKLALFVSLIPCPNFESRRISRETRATPEYALLRGAPRALDSREIKPEMPIIVVFAKDDLTFPANHGISELIAISPLFKD